VAASPIGDGSDVDGLAESAHAGRAVGKHHRAQADGALAVEDPGVRSGQQADLLLQRETGYQPRLIAAYACGNTGHDVSPRLWTSAAGTLPAATLS